jgi:NADH:ubiquinone oxidoreductase subunit 3 (subunit A)
VRGTTSCGGAAGYPLVALIFVAMVVVAALLLRLARVPEPTGTSLLGLGLTGVVALLFLVDVLLDGSMVVVIPLLTAGTFALSYTVTTRVADPARD